MSGCATRQRRRASRRWPADAGYRRALISILDANITTLISALIMFQFGAGPVKGFAWTLSIGVVTSVFTAAAGHPAADRLVVPRDAGAKQPADLRSVPPMRLAADPHSCREQTHFNFVGLAPYAAVLSALLVIASVRLVRARSGELRHRLRRRHQDRGDRRPGRRRSARSAPAAGQMGAKDAEVQGFGAPTRRGVQFRAGGGRQPGQRRRRGRGQAAGQDSRASRSPAQRGVRRQGLGRAVPRRAARRWASPSA